GRSPGPLGRFPAGPGAKPSGPDQHPPAGVPVHLPRGPGPGADRHPGSPAAGHARPLGGLTTALNRGLARFFAVMFLFWSSLYLYVPVMGPFAQQRGASLQLVGWLVSSYGLTQLLL